MSEAPRRPPTSLDVARLAGVSQAAVSLVFSGKAQGHIATDTRNAVLSAATQLGYRPNPAARALRAGRSNILALVATDIHHPFFASVLDGAETAAHSVGYTMLLVNMRQMESDWKSTIARALANHTVDGFILFAHHDASRADIQELGRKAVLIEASSASVPTLQLDIAGGFTAVLAHVLELGHTRIAHLAADYPSETFRVQRRHYLGELTSRGLEPLETRARFGLDEATAAADRLLRHLPRPTAVVCDDDLLAAGVYRAARQRNLRIPRDLSVTGFCDIELARELDPELTTVHIPAETIGAEAARLLIAWIEHGHQPASSAIIQLHFVERGSTARRA